MNVVKADQLNMYQCLGYSIQLQWFRYRQTKKLCHMIKNYDAENPNLKLLVKIILELALLVAMMKTEIDFCWDVLEIFYGIRRNGPETNPARLLPPHACEPCELNQPTRFYISSGWGGPWTEINLGQ